MTEEQESTSKELARDENGRLLPGQESLNPNGRPKGSKNFNTLLDQAIKQIAEANSLDDLQIEVDLLKMAIKKAREGDYQYYKDIMDRRYGQAKQKIDMGVDDEIKEIKVEIVK
jgi:hypothetical protein